MSALLYAAHQRTFSTGDASSAARPSPPTLRLHTLDLFGLDLGNAGLAMLLAFLHLTSDELPVGGLRATGSSAATLGASGTLQRLAVSLPLSVDLENRTPLATIPTAVPAKGATVKLMVLDDLIAYLRSPAAVSLRVLDLGYLTVHGPPLPSADAVSAAAATVAFTPTNRYPHPNAAASTSRSATPVTLPASNPHAHAVAEPPVTWTASSVQLHKIRSEREVMTSAGVKHEQYQHQYNMQFHPLSSVGHKATAAAIASSTGLVAATNTNTTASAGRPASPKLGASASTVALVHHDMLHGTVAFGRALHPKPSAVVSAAVQNANASLSSASSTSIVAPTTKEHHPRGMDASRSSAELLPKPRAADSWKTRTPSSKPHHTPEFWLTRFAHLASPLLTPSAAVTQAHRSTFGAPTSSPQSSNNVIPSETVSSATGFSLPESSSLSAALTASAATASSMAASSAAAALDAGGSHTQRMTMTIAQLRATLHEIDKGAAQSTTAVTDVSTNFGSPLPSPPSTWAVASTNTLSDRHDHYTPASSLGSRSRSSPALHASPRSTDDPTEQPTAAAPTSDTSPNGATTAAQTQPSQSDEGPRLRSPLVAPAVSSALLRPMRGSLAFNPVDAVTTAGTPSVASALKSPTYFPATTLAVSSSAPDLFTPGQHFAFTDNMSLSNISDRNTTVNVSGHTTLGESNSLANLRHHVERTFQQAQSDASSTLLVVHDGSSRRSGVDILPSPETIPVALHERIITANWEERVGSNSGIAGKMGAPWGSEVAVQAAGPPVVHLARLPPDSPMLDPMVGHPAMLTMSLPHPPHTHATSSTSVLSSSREPPLSPSSTVSSITLLPSAATPPVVALVPVASSFSLTKACPPDGTWNHLYAKDLPPANPKPVLAQQPHYNPQGNGQFTFAVYKPTTIATTTKSRGGVMSPSILSSFQRSIKGSVDKNTPTPMEKAIEKVYATALHVAMFPASNTPQTMQTIARTAKHRVTHRPLKRPPTKAITKASEAVVAESQEVLPTRLRQSASAAAIALSHLPVQTTALVPPCPTLDLYVAKKYHPNAASDPELQSASWSTAHPTLAASSSSAALAVLPNPVPLPGFYPTQSTSTIASTPSASQMPPPSMSMSSSISGSIPTLADLLAASRSSTAHAAAASPSLDTIYTGRELQTSSLNVENTSSSGMLDAERRPRHGRRGDSSTSDDDAWTGGDSGDDGDEGAVRPQHASFSSQPQVCMSECMRLSHRPFHSSTLKLLHS